MNPTESHEELIRQLKEVGESFIKNAKGIVGSDEYLTGLELSVVFDVDNALPEIKLVRTFLPERTIERYSHGEA